ncbi:MAG TPA: Mur ligase domain-containing protein [Gaiellaceae bacterium]|nr:Mur ligase domain-containing protein [Gaiellaceae bacterium]
MPPRELEGRRLWFVGIGGAGMSALAFVAAAWGAQVAGSDRRRSRFVPRLEEAGIRVVLGEHRAENVPAGSEVIVSSAIASGNPELTAPGATAVRHRAELLAELVSLRPSIVVGGAHGKTTTAAMIAFCLVQLGRDPTFLIGSEVPQLGGNAGAGQGWLVAEGDESDRSIELLVPTVAVLTNVDHDHHSTFASRAEVEESLERWLARARYVVRAEELEPVDLELAVPGEHNRRNAAAALAALELAGVPRAEAEPLVARYRGAGHRWERAGESAGVAVVTDYGHHPAEIAATIATARELARGRVLVVFRPLRYSRTRYLARELAASLAAADVVAVAEVYGADEPELDGVSGKLIVDALAERRPGMPLAWTPDLADAARFVARRARPGDIVLAQGADDVVTAAPLVLEALA